MGGVGYVRMFERISKKTNTSYVRTRCWTKDNTQKGMDWNGKKRRHDRGRNTRKIEGTDDTTGKKGIFLKNK
jgi:hypothetical protein